MLSRDWIWFLRLEFNFEGLGGMALRILREVVITSSASRTVDSSKLLVYLRMISFE